MLNQLITKARPAPSIVTLSKKTPTKPFSLIRPKGMQDANLQQFLKEYGDGSGLFYMGHASILCSFGGKRILFDPVVLSKPYGDAWTFYPPQVQDSELFEVDAVMVSHIHQDHYDIEYLRALDKRVKVIVIGGRPEFEEDLRRNNIKNLHIIEPETVVEIFDGVYVYGVTHEYNGIDASAIVYNHEFCIYHGNDNYLQPESLKKFKLVRPAIDVACIPYAFIHWYPFLLDFPGEPDSVKKAECDRLVNMYMESCLASIRILQPKAMIPFGANLLLDDGDAHSHMNLAVKSPFEFAEYASQQAPEFNSIVKPLLAGDFCGPDLSKLSFQINEDVNSSTYRSAADKYLKSKPVKKVPDWLPIDLSEFVIQLQNKLTHTFTPITHTIRVELLYLEEKIRIEVDCFKKSARCVEEFSDCLEFHQFNLDPVASGLWLNGKRFEEILGTRRFTVLRQPNIHNKEILRIVSTIL